MIIGILTVNDFAFHPNRRLRMAAKKRGHDALLINPYQLAGLLLNNTPGMFSRQFDQAPDLVMPRQGSPMGEYGFVVLRQFAQMGIPLLNRLDGVTIGRNQFITLQTLTASGIPVPDSCFITRPEYFAEAVHCLGGYPVVVKQVSGMGGEGVAMFATAAMAHAYLERFLDSRQGLVVQQFVPPEGRQDLRLLVIGGRVAGAMQLTPCATDFRANIHQAGTARPFEAGPELQQIAIGAARACCLDIAGVDLILDARGRPQVLEVNYSPGFQGLEAATGLNIADMIIDYALDFYASKCHAGRRSAEQVQK